VESLGVYTCNTTNIVKALEIAEKYLGESYGSSSSGNILTVSSGSGWLVAVPSPLKNAANNAIREADSTQSWAAKLKEVADELQQKAKDLEFLDGVLKSCRGD
jgi:hypothetical protein